VVKTKAVFVVIFMFAVFMFTGCSGKQSGVVQPPAVKGEPVTSEEYFPTAAGFYKRFDDGQGGWEETVQEKETYNGKMAVPIHTKMLNVKEQADEGGDYTLSDFTNFYHAAGREILLVGARATLDDAQIADEPIPVPSVIFKTGLKKGGAWTYDLYNPPGKVKVTVESFETLQTKAGTFEQTAKLKIDYAYVEPDGREVKAVAYEWYAPGYGKVKSQGEGEMGNAEVVEVKKER